MKQNIFNGLFLFAVLFTACKKNEFRRDEYTQPTGNAFVKVGYFSPDTTNPGVQIYINNNRVSNTITNNTPFPGGGYNTGGSTYNGYLAVTPGTATFRFVIPTTNTSIISKELFTLTAPVTANEQQVVYITDTGVNRTAFTVKAETSRPDSGYVKMQFVNCIPNAGPISFYYKDSLVADRVPYKGFVDFKTLPLYVTTIKIYPSDSAVTDKTLINSYSFSGISNQKVYTAIGRGFYKATNTQSAPKASLLIVK